jgi:hypothetical protein
MFPLLGVSRWVAERGTGGSFWQIEERLVSITYANILGHLFQNQRIEECVLRTQILLLPAKVNRSITPERKKYVLYYVNFHDFQGGKMNKYICFVLFVSHSKYIVCFSVTICMA